MAIPEIKVAPYIPHEHYGSQDFRVVQAPFPLPPSELVAEPRSLPRIQTQRLDHDARTSDSSLQVPAPAYQAHASAPVLRSQGDGTYLSRMPSTKSTYLSGSPIDPVRQSTSLQCFATPMESRFSQTSYEIPEPPPIVILVRAFMIRWIIEWWLMEILSWIFSTMCIAVVIGVLLMYDNQEIPQWPLGITINGFLSVFSAFAKAGLLLPVAECLGQLKW